MVYWTVRATNPTTNERVDGPLWCFTPVVANVRADSATVPCTQWGHTLIGDNNRLQRFCSPQYLPSGPSQNMRGLVWSRNVTLGTAGSCPRALRYENDALSIHVAAIRHPDRYFGYVIRSQREVHGVGPLAPEPQLTPKLIIYYYVPAPTPRSAVTRARERVPRSSPSSPYVRPASSARRSGIH